jgi:hypothetical protein
MPIAEEAPPTRPIPSSDLAEMAQQCLRRSPYPVAGSVWCEHRHGVLFLRGQLPSYYLKQVAQETVRKFLGEIRIVNSIEVDKSLQPTGEAAWRFLLSR